MPGNHNSSITVHEFSVNQTLLPLAGLELIVEQMQRHKVGKRILEVVDAVDIRIVVAYAQLTTM